MSNRVKPHVETVADQIQDALDDLEGADARLDTASALITKDYPLDPNNLVDSYFQQLDTAIAEFCSRKSKLPVVMNEVFEKTYRNVFAEEPAGTFSGGLSKK